MKKPNYPSHGEIEKLIATFERFYALRVERSQKSSEVVKQERALEPVICETLYVARIAGKPLSEYIKAYERNRRARSSDVDERIKALKAGYAELVALDKLLAEEAELEVKAKQFLAQAEGVKRAEYEETIDAVSNVLMPFCDGQHEVAEELASQTPVAEQLMTQRQRCYGTLYGPGNMISPLRAILEFSTTKSA